VNGLTVLPPLDLSPDHGGDADHPLPHQSPDDLVDDDEDQPEEDRTCLQRAA
jgi:hypothetical protein